MNLDFEITLSIMWIGFWLVCAIIVLFAKRYYRKRLDRDAGALLIECGRSAVGKSVLIPFGMWLAFDTFNFFWSPLPLMPMMPIVALYFFPDCLYRTQLRENAIVHDNPIIEGRRVPWRNIESVEWIRPGLFRHGLSVSLTLQDAKGLRGVAGDKIRFYVSESSRAEVEALIVEKSGAEVLTAASQLQVGSTAPSSSS